MPTKLHKMEFEPICTPLHRCEGFGMAMLRTCICAADNYKKEKTWEGPILRCVDSVVGQLMENVG